MVSMWNGRGRRSSRFLRRMLAVLAAGGAVTVLLTACNGGGSDTPGGSAKDSLVVGFPQEPATWNYLQDEATAIKSLLVYNVLEPLLQKTQDGALEPLLAESYNADSAGTTYRFTLREATFHNGDPVTADDVVYSLKQAKAATATGVSGPLQLVESINAVDDSTVEVKLSKPSRAFLQALSTASGIVIPKDSAGDLASTPVGTGPFKFDTWKNGVSVSLTRNDDYWGDAPAIKTVDWRFVPDENAEVNSLLAGDLDLAVVVGDGTQRAESVENADGYTVNTIVNGQESYVALNSKSPKFQDPRIRQAIAYAIDRQPIVDGTSNGFGEPSCVMVNPPTEAWQTDYCPYPTDPDEARELLQEAGAEDLTIEYPYIGMFSQGFQIIKQQLNDVGIDVEGESLELAAYLDRVLGKSQFEITNIGGPQQIDSWHCPPGFFTQDCDPARDKLLDEADAADTDEQWADLRRQAVEMMADSAYVIPIANSVDVVYGKDDLQGLNETTVASELDIRNVHWGS